MPDLFPTDGLLSPGTRPHMPMSKCVAPPRRTHHRVSVHSVKSDEPVCRATAEGTSSRSKARSTAAGSVHGPASTIVIIHGAAVTSTY